MEPPATLEDMDVLIVHSLTLLSILAEEGPEPEDVKAGWTAFAIWIGLGLAVVVLGFSLAKQMRKVQAAKDAGRYGDEPIADEQAEQDEQSEPGEQGPDDASNDPRA